MLAGSRNLSSFVDNTMLSLSIVPSLPAASREQLEALLTALAGTVREFQIDIVDGRFVPPVSWPFTESDPIAALATLAPWSQKFELEIDCMVTEPYQYLDTLVALGAKRIIVHLGSTTDYLQIIGHAKAHAYRLGFAATADTPLAELETWIPDINFVQLMGIAAVGQQRQPFDVRTLSRARELRVRYPDLEIAVDGAVNSVTIPLLYAAGVNRFAPGSAVAEAADPVLAYEALRTLIAPH